MPRKTPEAHAKKRLTNKQKREAERKARLDAMHPKVKRSSPAYRNQLPRLPTISKSEMRAFIERAFVNTAQAQ